MKKLIALFLVVTAFSGCVTTTDLFYDQGLRSASTQLSMDYLNGQKNGEPYKLASEKYGPGVSEFVNLQEIQGCDRHGKLYWESAVACRVKAGNKFGGVTWSDYSIFFSYSPELNARGDKYSGLRIKNVVESSLASED